MEYGEVGFQGKKSAGRSACATKSAEPKKLGRGRRQTYPFAESNG
jgi:hypothetical protein